MRELVELLRISRLSDGGGLVVRLERLLDLLGVVDEVEDEGVFLAGSGAVETRERLHRLDTRQALVDVHRVQQRLIEAGLVLVGDDQDTAAFLVELSRESFLRNTEVHTDLGELPHLVAHSARERH
jgi:hypothetical protein